jgi:uncharacterized protein HemX
VNSNDPTTLLRQAARLLRDGDVQQAGGLMRQADEQLGSAGAAPESTYRGRLALAAALAALGAGDAGRLEDKLAEAFRLLGLDDTDATDTP